jgi:glutathione S-transferase
MFWIHLITILALFQFLLFGSLVGHARGKYGVHAPATAGHEIFERYYRVQMNTLELLIVFLPSLWIAANYWKQQWVAVAGAVYLVGRFVYLRAYIKNPSMRSLGFALSMLPILALMIAGLAGVGLALLKGVP